MVPWEQRLARRRPSTPGGFGFVSVADYLTQPVQPSSCDRLERVPADDRNPSIFISGAQALVQAFGLAVSTFRRGDQLPPLDGGVSFKYAVPYAEYGEELPIRDDVLVATVWEAKRVIGFGIAEQSGDEWEIKLIDVDTASRRSSGVEHALTILQMRFGVGVGHIVVAELLSAIPRGRVTTDATSDQSRYIFKSLGFVEKPGATNPCLLEHFSKDDREAIT